MGKNNGQNNGTENLTKIMDKNNGTKTSSNFDQNGSTF